MDNRSFGPGCRCTILGTRPGVRQTARRARAAGARRAYHSRQMDFNDRPMDRRRFFREGLRELLKPLSKAAEPIERALKEFETIQEPRVSRARPGSSSARVFLRPPGALV